jgi:hypothetical protein
MRKVDRGPSMSGIERLVLEASTALRLADTAVLATPQEDGMRHALDEFLAHILELLYRTADAIDDSFVRPLPLHPQIAPS